MAQSDHTNLSMVVIPRCEWESVKRELKEIKDLLIQKSKEEVNNQWIESSEARKILGISAKTWQTFRDERIIPFSQFGRKIYVKRADLDAFFEKNKCRALPYRI